MVLFERKGFVATCTGMCDSWRDFKRDSGTTAGNLCPFSALVINTIARQNSEKSKEPSLLISDNSLKSWARPPKLRYQIMDSCSTGSWETWKNAAASGPTNLVTKRVSPHLSSHSLGFLILHSIAEGRYFASGQSGPVPREQLLLVLQQEQLPLARLVWEVLWC